MDNRDLSFSHLLYLTAHHWRLAVDHRLRGLGMSQASWVAVTNALREEMMMGEDPRLTATAIQTVGIKGWDGFTLAWVKA